MAQADSVEIGDRLAEILRPIAINTRMEEPETAIKVVKTALRQVRTELVEWNSGVPIDPLKFFCSEHRLTLLIGYYFNCKPYLYTMDIYRGLYTQVKSFEAIGAGQVLGYFLLKEYSQAVPDFDHGFPISVSIVDKVADNVDGCNQPIWTAHVYPIPFDIQSEERRIKKSTVECQAIVIPRRETDLILSELRVADLRGASIRKEEILKAMKRAAKKHRLIIQKEMYAREPELKRRGIRLPK
jgi:hypothetical protein